MGRKRKFRSFGCRKRTSIKAAIPPLRNHSFHQSFYANHMPRIRESVQRKEESEKNKRDYENRNYVVFIMNIRLLWLTTVAVCRKKKALAATVCLLQLSLPSTSQRFLMQEASRCMRVNMLWNDAGTTGFMLHNQHVQGRGKKRNNKALNIIWSDDGIANSMLESEISCDIVLYI
jgi:hypothetical protein